MFFFSFQLRKKNITRSRRIGCNLNVMRQTACLVSNQRVRLYDGPNIKLFILGPELLA